MKIVVMSDSHYDERSVEVIRTYIEDADVILHCGDGAPDVEILKDSFKGEVYAVCGNCDMNCIYPQERLLEFYGVKIFMTHGHRYNVKNEYHSIAYRGREVDASIVLFGHSHKAIIDKDQGITIMNPGSISLPYGGKKKTIGIIEILDENKVNIFIQEI
ncbi:metallophosphoesterase [Clostridium sp.]|uniref:metallophosphoesterase n=1 Tax=Clostridium sp. TaxID=1506 RepID=UPI0026237C46|nr:metallophosphoesterase [Clostridium sp.]